MWGLIVFTFDNDINYEESKMYLKENNHFNFINFNIFGSMCMTTFLCMSSKLRVVVLICLSERQDV